MSAGPGAGIAASSAGSSPGPNPPPAARPPGGTGHRSRGGAGRGGAGPGRGLLPSPRALPALAQGQGQGLGRAGPWPGWGRCPPARGAAPGEQRDWPGCGCGWRFPSPGCSQGSGAPQQPPPAREGGSRGAEAPQRLPLASCGRPGAASDRFPPRLRPPLGPSGELIRTSGTHRDGLPLPVCSVKLRRDPGEPLARGCSGARGWWPPSEHFSLKLLNQLQEKPIHRPRGFAPQKKGSGLGISPSCEDQQEEFTEGTSRQQNYSKISYSGIVYVKIILTHTKMHFEIALAISKYSTYTHRAYFAKQPLDTLGLILK
ncbi:uncharacterized protein LOC142024678 [Carettochelys insculpta]|uniref:uncharacterized protein LOC142024678 n=1 Tax=Carettochelys insculpta TaxID=44489 RepID=UPI003EB8E5BE